jgi:hypothetical protein
MTEGRCTFCGAEIQIEDRVGRRDECPQCRRDLHACLQCRFYDRSYHNQCRETQAEYVGDKERSNFCDYFQFGRESVSEKSAAEDAKQKLKGLFKK